MQATLPTTRCLMVTCLQQDVWWSCILIRPITMISMNITLFSELRMRCHVCRHHPYTVEPFFWKNIDPFPLPCVCMYVSIHILTVTTGRWGERLYVDKYFIYFSWSHKWSKRTVRGALLPTASTSLERHSSTATSSHWRSSDRGAIRMVPLRPSLN